MLRNVQLSSFTSEPKLKLSVSKISKALGTLGQSRYFRIWLSLLDYA